VSISTSGRKVKVCDKTDINNCNKLDGALKYNHLHIKFTNGDQKHLLFSDNQMRRAYKRVKVRKENLPKIIWLREIWYEDFIEIAASDVENVIVDKKLPSVAAEYNHIRVDCKGKEAHLLFTDYEIQTSLKRAEKYVLPSMSWLSDGNELWGRQTVKEKR
jgi:hypothetical protein|tara:strand:- start:10162 stop:10641 length:480 start_codon:yes stop_codon:yes gene_type:complete